MKTNYVLIAMLAGTLASGPAFAEGFGGGRSVAAQQTAPPPAKPDSTKANKQSGKTADQQSQDKADLDLVKRIRQAIIKDKSLSTTAHNCKVITNNGAVPLRGPVQSAKEKTTVEKIATDIAGQGKVTNNLVVKTSGK